MAPDIVVVMTDDQTKASFAAEAMPFATELFADERSAVFDSAIATPPLCCPARATFLTGHYPHKHGILGNEPGYPELRGKDQTLPVWLARAGYDTAFVGKYLNGYEQKMEPAPGWRSWHANFNFPNYYDYIVNDDGELTHYGSRRSDYSTTQMTRRAVAEVASQPAERPLFMWLAYNAPHVTEAPDESCPGLMPKPPSPAAFTRFARVPLPRDPSFDEADRSDKPPALAAASALDRDDLATLALRWRCTLASLRPVDAGIERLVEALRESGRLERTVLVFVSDNGYFFGEHALTNEKRLPYRPSAEVPLAIRVGSALSDATVPSQIDELVGTVDLAPTILDFAGADPCRSPGDCRPSDGRSLRGLLSGEDREWPADRALLLELDETYTYEALRTSGHLYSRTHADPSGPISPPALELYDLDADPYELENLLPAGDRETAALARRLGVRLDRLSER